MMGPQIDILLSTIPLLSKEDKEDLTLFSFVPIEGDHIIVGPVPWRLVRKKPDGALILVHKDDFPINYSSNVLCHKLLVAMLMIPSLTLEAMHLHLEDVITHYLNVKCTFVIPKHGSLKESIYYDKPYNCHGFSCHIWYPSLGHHPSFPGIAIAVPPCFWTSTS